MLKRIFLITILLGGISYGLIAYAHATMMIAPNILSFTPLTHERSDTLSISFVGDMVPTENDAYNFAAFQNVAAELSTADLTIGNFEGTLALPERVGKCDTSSPKCFAFRGNISFVESLKTAGFDFVSLVNNHSLDFGTEGVSDTEYTLTQAGLSFVSPLNQTKEFVIKNMKVGIVGVSSGPVGHKLTDYEYIKSTVADLKTRNDFVILIFHGGAEGADKTAVPGTEEFVGTENRGNVELLAHTAIDAGADLVLGSGPHVLRKLETYNGKLIAYSLGNFVGGNKKLNTRGILGTSGILNVTLSKDTRAAFTLTSVSLSPEGVPSPDLTNQGLQLINSLTFLN